MTEMLKVSEVMELLRVKQATAYKAIRDLNRELEKQGYYTLAGRIPKDYLCKRYNLK